jgi:hypothetical protein
MMLSMAMSKSREAPFADRSLSLDGARLTIDADAPPGQLLH